MKIVYLLESTELWGGVKSVLEAANRLHHKGHEVLVLSRTPAPGWIDLECGFATVNAFERGTIPEADVIVGTFWTTVRAAIESGRGIPVHYCQGYEGDNPENQGVRDQIEEVYRMPAHKLTISPHLTNTLRTKFDCEPRQLRYAIDHGVMFPGPARLPGKPVRIGLVGPWSIAWKDIRTGLQACDLASRAGLDLQVVRVTNTNPDPEESAFGLDIEWHTQIAPADMGELYRSFDIFVGSSWGDEEGFFMPAVEAMACGVPAVLTDIPCHRGYGEGNYALFVPPKSPAEMAEAIVIASGHADVRAALRTNGLEAARAFQYDTHVADVEQALQELIAAAPQRSPEPQGVDLGWSSQELIKLTEATAATLRCLSEAYTAAQLPEAAERHAKAANTILDGTEHLQRSGQPSGGTDTNG